MKTTIYDLLGMIKDNKAPKKILLKDKVFGLSEDNKNYIDEDSDWLFIDYEWLDMLNDEVEILETTLIAKDMNITSRKIEKIEEDMAILSPTGPKIQWTLNEGILKDKINEIIDVLNNNK